MVNALDNTTVRKIAVQIHICPPPLFCRIGTEVIALLERRQIGPVGDAHQSLVGDLPLVAFYLVHVSVGQTVLFEESPVHLLDGHVKPPEVAVILCSPAGQRGMGGVQKAVFIALVNDSKMKPVRLWCGRAHHIEQFEGDGLEHSLFAAMLIVSLLNARGEVELVPGGLVFSAVIVLRLEEVAAVKIELPHVFAHGVPPGSAAGAVADMIVDVAVINQRTKPLIITTRVFLEPGTRFHVRLLAD